MSHYKIPSLPCLMLSDHSYNVNTPNPNYVRSLTEGLLQSGNFKFSFYCDQPNTSYNSYMTKFTE